MTMSQYLVWQKNPPWCYKEYCRLAEQNSLTDEVIES